MILCLATWIAIKINTHTQGIVHVKCGQFKPINQDTRHELRVFIKGLLVTQCTLYIWNTFICLYVCIYLSKDVRRSSTVNVLESELIRTLKKWRWTWPLTKIYIRREFNKNTHRKHKWKSNAQNKLLYDLLYISHLQHAIWYLTNVNQMQ